MSKNKFQFIVNSDVELLVSYLQEDNAMSLLEAFDVVYSSAIYEKLMNPNTGLYLQSADYIYDYLKDEMAQAN
ncbi:MAG: hypothetical protein IJP75_06065 [Bacteroidaceae bacterium]|nr:hypothetical protein [Bacteroidaceae bacterium]